MKRVLSLILVLVLALGLLAACSGEDDVASSNNQSVDNGTANLGFSKDTVTLINEESKSNYRLIRPADNQEMFDISATLFVGLREKLSISVKNIDDSSSDGADAYEILLGHTNRPESKFAYDYLVENIGGRFDDYIICTVGKKIVIHGLNADAISNAATHFLNNLASPAPIEGGIMYTHKTEGTFTDITVNGINISKFSIVRPLYNVSYLAQMEMQKLYDYVKQTTGFEVEIVKDENVAAGDYEIIVGDSSREGVTVFDKNDTDLFSVRIEGNKVYLNGGSTYATAAAVTEFTNMLKDGKAETSESVAEGSYSSVVANYDQSKYYTPAWLEDFKGTELDTTKWMHISWSGEGQNGKTSKRTTDTYSFDGEYFTITPYQTETEYHGGMIRTHRNMNYLYGYVEESAKLPTAPGFWTALWTGDAVGFGFGDDKELAEAQLLGNEIDINENFGGNNIAANCHSWPTALGEQAGYKHTSCDTEEYKNDKKFSLANGDDLHDDFHTYGMMWTPEYMSFTADGEVYFTYDTTATEQDILSFNQRMFLTLSMAVGLKSGGSSIGLATEEAWANRSTLVVDYVHLYQLDDGLSTIDTEQK